MTDHAAEKKKKNNDTNEKSILTPMSLPSKFERNSSLDIEPKTLLENELNLAREAALKIINTHSKEEALKIFLTGLKPVTSNSLKAKVEDNIVISDYNDE